MQKKNVTCAAIIKTPSGYLIVHPTGNDTWSLPKGLKEENESPSEAAIREVREETGFVLSGEMIDFGRYSYTKEKDIQLFFVEVKSDIDVDQLKCDSFFTPKGTTKRIPEVDAFAIVSLEQMIDLLGPLQAKIIKSFKFSSNSKYLLLE